MQGTVLFMFRVPFGFAHRALQDNIYLIVPKFLSYSSTLRTRLRNQDHCASRMLTVQQLLGSARLQHLHTSFSWPRHGNMMRPPLALEFLLIYLFLRNGDGRCW